MTRYVKKSKEHAIQRNKDFVKNLVDQKQIEEAERLKERTESLKFTGERDAELMSSYLEQ